MSRFSRNLASSISTDKTDGTDLMETQVADSTGAERSSGTVSMSFARGAEARKGRGAWMRGLISRASRGGVSPAEGGNRYSAVAPDSSLAMAGTVQTFAVSGAKRLSRIGRATALSMSLAVMIVFLMLAAMASAAMAAPRWRIDSVSNTTVAPGGQFSTTSCRSRTLGT